MVVSAAVLWFIAALAALAAEMFLGTFYLLMVAAGCAAAGAAAWADLSSALQLSLCAVVTVVGCCAVRIYRRRAARRPDEAERLMQLDSGQLVKVERVTGDGLSVVQYRGAAWIARPSAMPLSPGLWTIERVDGAQLVLGEPVGQAERSRAARR